MPSKELYEKEEETKNEGVSGLMLGGERQKRCMKKREGKMGGRVERWRQKQVRYKYRRDGGARGARKKSW